MRIERLEEIATQKIRDVLRNIYSETIRIENCQIDKIEYHGDRIRW